MAAIIDGLYLAKTYEELARTMFSQTVEKATMLRGNEISFDMRRVEAEGWSDIGKIAGGVKVLTNILCIKTQHYEHRFLWSFKVKHEQMFLFFVDTHLLNRPDLMLETSWVFNAIMDMAYEKQTGKPVIRTNTDPREEENDWYLRRVGLEMPVLITSGWDYVFNVSEERHKLEVLAHRKAFKNI